MEAAVRRLRGPDAFASRDGFEAFCAALRDTAVPNDADGFVTLMPQVFFMKGLVSGLGCVIDIRGEQKTGLCNFPGFSWS